MALDKSTFETINPLRFTTFTFPNPLNPTALLRIAVLDSPSRPAESARVAAMFVPAGRESDWVFSSESGHLQLLLASPGLSRLVLAGDHRPGDSCRIGSIYRRLAENDTSCEVRELLKPLFLALSPKSTFERGIPEIPILSYEDGVASSVVIGVFVGNFVGEMLVEDVEIGNGKCSEREFRRRLRFKRMPNLVQTQVRVLPNEGFGLDCDGIGEFEFTVDVGVLVHPYLAPMVASLALINDSVEEKTVNGFKPKALCLGVGGGALVSFLGTRLGFEVWGVEEDEEVLRVGRKFFGLQESEFVKLRVGDATEFLETAALRVRGENGSSLNGFGAEGFDAEFDVIMVDLDSRDLENGASAPPMEFRSNRVLSDARSILADKGILVVNVVPQSVAIYDAIKRDFRKFFGELYAIDVGNEENFVLIAAISPIRTLSNVQNSFADKLRKAISGAFMESIRKT